MSTSPRERASLADAREPRGNRRVLLHVGAPKSGTSYLQDRLDRNRELLAEQGIHYLPTRSGDHFEAALDLIERPWAGELKKARGQWQELVDAARKVRGDVLISHEILAAATPEQVRRAFDSFPDDEVHVIVTARDLGRQLPAEWQEMIKHRAVRSWRRFVRAVKQARRRHSELWFWRVQSLPDVLTRWSTGLTPAQVHVVTVPPPGAPRETLWERFGGVLGLDPDVEYADSDNANASLGIAEIAVIRRLNKLLRKGGVGRDVYVPVVRELIAGETFGTHRGREGEAASETAVVPPKHRRFVRRVTREWIEWIDGSGVDVVGDLDDLVPRWPEPDPTEPPPRHPDRPDEQQVSAAAIEALAAVLVAWDRRDRRERREREHTSPVRRLAPSRLRGG